MSPTQEMNPRTSSERPEAHLSLRQPLNSIQRAAPAAARGSLFPGSDEIFRYIYTRASLGVGDVLAISSSIAGEGKTMVSLGLAVTIAEDFPERRVLLIEAELQRPVLAKDFAVEPSPGLTEVLHGEHPIEAACRPSYLENLDLMPAGAAGARAGRVLRSNHMANLIDSLRQTYDVVILDAPALLANSDALVLTDLADGIIFVIRSGVTPTHLIAKAVEQLDESKLRGVVLNSIQPAAPNWLRRLVGA